MDDLKKVSHLLYAPGEVMPGIEMSLAEACARGSAAALQGTLRISSSARKCAGASASLTVKVR